MKIFLTKLFTVILLIKASVSLSQISVRHNDFDVTDDVVKIEQYQYKPTTDINKDELRFVDVLKFKNGYIQSKNHTSHSKENSTINYNFTNDYKEFQYYYKSSMYGTDNIDYHRINFNNQTFYFPKRDFKILKNELNKYFKFSYNNSFSIEEVAIELSENKHIQISDRYNIRTYNPKGKLLFENSTKGLSTKRINYYPDGLLRLETIIHGKYYDRPEKKYFFYKKDEKGNWVKK